MNEKYYILGAIAAAILYRTSTKTPKLFSTVLAATAGAVAVSMVGKK